MCGVVSIVYDEHNERLGEVGSFLLKKLEYRGYDSTGGAFLQEDGHCILKKKVGAPSVVTQELEMEKIAGRRFIGQVRWATYGAVTDDNAQPHEVRCHTHIVGAHNGNISNTDSLKEFLSEHGHQVVSDNDGEMLVHLIEHFYARELGRLAMAETTEAQRITAMVAAIRKAESQAEGSYAACVTAPDIQGVFAIKAGSSLYAGKGSDSGGDFVVVSSDLTSVLAKTRFLIPLSEGECVYFTASSYELFGLRDERQWTPPLTRSRLNIADIALAPKYHYFMEQEIFTSAKNLQPLLRYYFTDDEETTFFAVFEAHTAECRELLYAFLQLYQVFSQAELATALAGMCAGEGFAQILSEIKSAHPDFGKATQSSGFASEDAPLLHELSGLPGADLGALLVMDRMLIWKKKRRILQHKEEVLSTFREIRERGGRIFTVASGTSFHAALSGGYFFNQLAKLAIIPANPGSFRAMYMNTLTEGDVLVGVSQSGETKDLVDIFSDVREQYGDKVRMFGIVNNENSTLPQEKVDFYLPILCGPEIAVAATKSFTSQLALLYILAASIDAPSERVKKALEKIIASMEFTLRSVDPEITEVAMRLYLRPSLHILGTSLAGLSREGALKIREVVLNHTEGYDAAEFKHGPNTILGKNTIFSLGELEHLHTDLLESFSSFLGRIDGLGPLPTEPLQALLHQLQSFKLRKLDEAAMTDLGTSRIEAVLSQDEAAEEPWRTHLLNAYREHVQLERSFSSYPLMFVCPPDPRDKRITITQIHTHKIRGADIILLAEDDQGLEKAASGRPAGFAHYESKFVRLPSSGDKIVFHFNATIALQLLALRMSVAKMKYLNNLKVGNHGVHPDVPKNVSKSITVD